VVVYCFMGKKLSPSAPASVSTALNLSSLGLNRTTVWSEGDLGPQGQSGTNDQQEAGLRSHPYADLLIDIKCWAAERWTTAGVDLFGT